MPGQLYLLSNPRYKDDIWALTNTPVRKSKVCEVTGLSVKGVRAFSPITNGNNRMHRISVAGMNILLRG